MRIRQVRREFWTDRRIALLPPRVRLFYIGLWAVADDDGYLITDLAQIAGELFPFDGYKHREAVCGADWGQLLGEGRVVLLECGKHARIPTLPEHQKIGGEKSYPIREEHKRECSVVPHRNMEDYPSNVTVSNVTVGGGTEGDSGRAKGGAPRPLREIIGPFQDVISRKGA